MDDDYTELYKVIECFGMKFGILICWDIEFPEPMRILGLKDVDCVFNLVAMPGTPYYNNTSRIFPRCRATENTCFLVYCNYPQPFFGGESCIISPNGNELSKSGVESEQVLISLINKNNYIKYKNRNEYFKYRRPNDYKLICKL